MPLLLQHLLVLTLVAGCAAYALRGGLRTLFGKRGGIGSCCAKGCVSAAKQSSPAAAKSRIVFLPVEFVGSPKK